MHQWSLNLYRVSLFRSISTLKVKEKEHNQILMDAMRCTERETTQSNKRTAPILLFLKITQILK
jgi:hypothetical protein